MVVGSAPTGFHRWTVKMRESLRIIVEHHFGRRVGENAAVPVQLAVDARGRKCRRKRAGGHDMLHVQLAAAAVEIRHLAGAHVRRRDREARPSAVDQLEVDELGESGLKRRCRVVAGVVCA
jgi:hypothetical protein